MRIENKLKELGITLPEAPPAVAAYEPWVRTGNLVVTSGQLPWQGGSLAFTGKLGADLNDEQGYQAARICAINAIAQLKAAAGDLERIRRIVRLEGNVHCAAGFRGHPQVLNGASHLFNEVFGERGRHTRTALGIHEMPLDAPVQLSVYAEISDETPEPEQRPGGETSISHFTLATRNVFESVRFFTATVGWPQIDRPANVGRPGAWLQIAPSQQLHLVEAPDFEPSPFEGEYGRHVAITFPLSGFAALKSRLAAFGVEIITPQRATPFQRFFFRDPNGYVFEVVAGSVNPA